MRGSRSGREAGVGVRPGHRLAIGIAGASVAIAVLVAGTPLGRAASADLTGTLVPVAEAVTQPPGGSPVPTPPAGAVSPDPSPFLSSGTAANPTPVPTSGSSPTPAPSAAPVNGEGGGPGGFLGTLLVVVVVGGVSTFLVRGFAGSGGRRGR